MFKLLSSLVSSIIQIITPIVRKFISWAVSNPLHALAGFLFVQLYSLVLGTNLGLVDMAIVFFWGVVLYSVGQFIVDNFLSEYLSSLFKRSGSKPKQIGEGQATAQWATQRELQQATLLDSTGLLLGKWEQKKQPSTAKVLHWQQEGHLLTVAPTGAGKGVGVVIPNLLTYPGAVVAIDPKGENYQISAHARRRMGQAVYRLDPFHVCGDEHLATLNPLDLLDPESDDFADDALVIADMLVLRTGNEKDPHWMKKP